MTRSTSRALLGLIASSAPASAFFLIPCWPVTTQRIDPIVNPGDMSSHLHQVVGGSGFAPAMNYSDTQAASCTTCFVSKDKSNYWIPAMYYQHQDGSFERVKQVGSTSVYYFNEASRLGSGEKVEAFPEGLRMLAGDPTKRADDDDFETKALNYKCLDYNGVPSDHRGFPEINCPNGVRAEVTFPSCWDGKNLDSDNHKSHMSYPTGNFENGACPDTHPHHVTTMKVEFIFDTNAYKDQWYNGKNPFVWADGDPTGYGLHADYLMGWDNNVLQAAVDECLDPNGVLDNCAPFAGLLPNKADTYMNPGTCTVEDFVDEDIGVFGSIVAKLPGCNELSWGPSKALKQTCESSAKLVGDWSWAKTGVKNTVNSVVDGLGTVVNNIVAPGQFYQKEGSESAAAATTSVAPTTTTTTSTTTATTTTTTFITTTTQAPPPPPPVAAVETTTTPAKIPNVVIVTDIVYETHTEFVQATATQWANKRDESAHAHEHKRHVHQHIHRRNRRAQAEGHF